MFTQFFGNYLVSEEVVTQKQLFEAIQLKKNIKVKLGVLAINAGLLTSKDVEIIHEKQMTEDRPFGDIAVSLGYVTKAQIEELLVSQMPDYLLLGQALIDLGAIDNAKFEQELNNYKNKFSLDDKDLKTADSKKFSNIIKGFFDFSKSKNEGLMIDYAELLIKNLIRFIGDDFILLNPDDFNQSLYNNCYCQDVMLEFSTTLSVCGEDDALIAFSSRYAGEEFTAKDEYIDACVNDFINLNNGLFIVNVSQNNGIELTLTPPEIRSIDSITEAPYIISAKYPFGVINFIFV